MPGGQVPQGGHGLRLVSGAQLVGGFLVEDDLSDSVVPQCPRIQAATASGWAWVMGNEQTRVAPSRPSTPTLGLVPGQVS